LYFLLPPRGGGSEKEKGGHRVSLLLFGFLINTFRNDEKEIHPHLSLLPGRERGKERSPRMAKCAMLAMTEKSSRIDGKERR